DGEMPSAQSSASASDTGDDRSQTPPAGTPHKRLLELSPNPRQRLVSEPTTPNRQSLLRNGANTPGSLLRRGHTPRGELMTVDEGEGKSPANGSAKKSRTPIPLEFLNADPHPSAHVDESDASAGSPSLATSSGTLGGPDSRTSRRPRPPGLRNSYDRWGESYDKWEKSQMERQEDSPADTDSSMQQQQRRGLWSVVNESLKAAGLTPTSATSVTSGTSSMRRKAEDEGARPRKLSTGVLGRDVFANSPMSSVRERNWESMDLTKARSSTEKERPRSRISPEDQDSRSDIDSLRDRVNRHPFFSPNVRATRTIHNVLGHPEDSASTNGVDIADGRETPANLRIFKSNYSSQFTSSPMMKSYTSPSGTQRTLPPRAATVANLSTGSPKVGTNGSPMSAVNTSSGNLSTSGGPVQLLQDALFMFESHVQRLPQSSAMPDTFNDVLRDAKGIVHAASSLNIALRSAATICVDEQIDAEVEAQAANATKEGSSPSEIAEVWRKVGAEFREDVRASDELVRALTSFMIGTGRMLRTASSANHNRMKSIGDNASTVGSVSRAGGTSLSRGTSLVRGVGGGSSDGRRS
ncbi:17200_t:CDS:2, partial [Acaulospora colombiana]